MKILCPLALVFALYISCNEHKYDQYAIRDFSSTLQPYLRDIVEEGLAGYDTAAHYFRMHATDEELTKLSHSEHPVLRAVALRIMVDRKSFNHFDVLMSHLDDTGHFHFDYGEWGVGFTTVSDDLINDFEFDSQQQKDTVIDEVIKKHNYLRSAYIILPKIEPKPEYYPYIKAMAEAERPYPDISKALYRLASYKKPGDIPFIKEQLRYSYSWDDELSFKLMEELPDTSYISVLTKYYKKHLYRYMCEQKNSLKLFLTHWQFISKKKAPIFYRRY